MRSFGILPASVDKLAVKSDLPLLVVPKCEFLSDSYTSGSAHEQSLVRLAVAPFDSFSQGIDISCWHRKSFFPLGYTIRGSAFITGNNRQPTGHCLESHKSQGAGVHLPQNAPSLRHGLILNRARLARARRCG